MFFSTIEIAVSKNISSAEVTVKFLGSKIMSFLNLLIKFALVFIKLSTLVVRILDLKGFVI